MFTIVYMRASQYSYPILLHVIRKAELNTAWWLRRSDLNPRLNPRLLPPSSFVTPSYRKLDQHRTSIILLEDVRTQGTAQGMLLREGRRRGRARGMQSDLCAHRSPSGGQNRSNSIRRVRQSICQDLPPMCGHHSKRCRAKEGVKSGHGTRQQHTVRLGAAHQCAPKLAQA